MKGGEFLYILVNLRIWVRKGMFYKPNSDYCCNIELLNTYFYKKTLQSYYFTEGFVYISFIA